MRQEPGEAFDLREFPLPAADSIPAWPGAERRNPDRGSRARDFWRWTHSWLIRQIEAAGDWEDVRIQPQGELVTTLGYPPVSFSTKL